MKTTANRRNKSTKTTIKGSRAKELIVAEIKKTTKATHKETGIENGGETVINEAVGMHFRIAKTALDKRGFN